MLDRSLTDLRVVVAHDWLVSYGGSERVVEALIDLLPQARLLTTVVDRDRIPRSLRAAEPSFLDRLPLARSHHEWLLPAMPLAWRTFPPVGDADIVISSSHACAKAVRVVPGIPHVCYCHTPMRYAWDFESEAERFPTLLRSTSRLAMFGFRRWDRSASRNVAVFVANSTAVAGRIERFYRREARVVHPPVRTEFFTHDSRVRREEFFLYVGRLVGYKRPDLVVDAFASLPYRLIVVGSGLKSASLRARASENVTFLDVVDDATLRDLYRRAAGFVYPAEEDFGIAMAEAQSCGTPVIAMGAGGALDIVDDGHSGVLIREPTTRALRAAVVQVAESSWHYEAISRAAERFALDRFRSQMADAIWDALGKEWEGLVAA